MITFKTTYKQAKADHEYLWSIAPASDMTGGYIDQDDLDKLLKNPTKDTARNCYIDQIVYWFEKGPEHDDLCRSWYLNPRLLEIAERHYADVKFINWANDPDVANFIKDIKKGE